LNPIEKLFLSSVDHSKKNKMIDILAGEYKLRLSKSGKGDFFVGGYGSSKNAGNSKRVDNKISHMREMNVDIVERLEPKELLEKLDVSMLYSTLKTEKDSFYMKKNHEYSYEDSRSCSQMKSVVNKVKMKNSNQYFTLLDEAVALYGNDKELIKEHLHQAEPGFSDCYSDRYSDRFRFKKSESFEMLAKFANKGDTIKFIEEFSMVNLSKEEVSALFWNEIIFRAENTEIFIMNGIIPAPDDLYNIGQDNVVLFQTLIDMEVEIDETSKSGRSLIDFAAEVCNVELIEELFNKKYKYIVPELGADSLDIALSSDRCRNSRLRVETIAALLKYKPNIKSHHRRKLAALRLNDWSTYQKIATEFPLLSVEPNESIMSKYCRIY
jgi:hypothetical protein